MGWDGENITEKKFETGTGWLFNQPATGMEAPSEGPQVELPLAESDPGDSLETSGEQLESS